MRTEIIDQNSPHLAEVKRLGKEHASTLGFFPEGAFDEHAQKRQIIVALQNDKCFGYLLYRISKRSAKIVHLCVSPSVRGWGMARLLVDALKANTADLDGIGLRCRLDYDANKIWSKLGFVPLSEIRGRSAEGSTLVQWWYDHGHPTLFDLGRSSTDNKKIDIVVDANVFFDFHDESRNGYVESNSMKADWLEDALTINLVDEIYNEFIRCPDEETRRLSRERAGRFNILKSDPNRLASTYSSLALRVTPVKPFLSERDISDLRQVSSAIAGDASYFITRDEFLLSSFFREAVEQEFGLRILRPLDLIKEIDEIHRERDYSPASLAGTELKLRLVRVGEENDLSSVFHRKERRTDFQNRFRGLLSDVENNHCYTVRDTSDGLYALIVFSPSIDGRMYVPMLRIRPNKLAATLIRHIVQHLLNTSVKLGHEALEISDLYLDPETEEALTEEGFLFDQQQWVKFHVPIVAPRNLVAERIQSVRTKNDLEADFLKGLRESLTKDYSELTPIFFSDFERLLYPVKISDSLISSFIVPIRPNWAKELFDSNLAEQGLFSSKTDLAIRKEQVYYRSARNSAGIKAPARILWYVSKGRSAAANVGAIRACSLVDYVEIGKPKPLFSKYKRLGIYEWSNIFELAKKDVNQDIMAIKFSQTELFLNPLPIASLRTILQYHHKGLQLQSVSRISQGVFTDIYKQGMNL